MWKLDQVIGKNKEIFHDWEQVAFVPEEEIEPLKEFIQKWVSIFLPDSDDETFNCCCDLVLLFALEDLEHNEVDPDEMIMNYSRIISSLISCNNFVKSKINWR